MDLSSVPYPKLSDYHFFSGEMKNLQPAYGVLPFKPTSELFSDYAQKKRFVWLPENTKATYNGDYNVLELPVGAALVKNFYYNNVAPLNTLKIIETRVMIHQQTGWIFAEYLWNEAQTEAYLQELGSTVPITWTNDDNITTTIEYTIPSEENCVTCHAKDNVNLPIGIKPQNLNSSFNYADGIQNQLDKLIAFGYLEDDLPASIISMVDYNDSLQPLDLRARSYIDINCAHCHQDGGNTSFVAQRYGFEMTSDPENLGVCVAATLHPPGIPHGRIVWPGSTANSVLFYGLNTTNSFWRMPKLGRTVIHQEGVALIEEWINSLPECGENDEED